MWKQVQPFASLQRAQVIQFWQPLHIALKVHHPKPDLMYSYSQNQYRGLLQNFCPIRALSGSLSPSCRAASQLAWPQPSHPIKHSNIILKTVTYSRQSLFTSATYTSVLCFFSHLYTWAQVWVELHSLKIKLCNLESKPCNLHRGSQASKLC